MSKVSAFELDALDSRIRELVAYARERGSEDRSSLFRNLVDLFLTGKAPKTEPTRNQLLDVLRALIPHVEADSRRTACDLVANMATPPMDLVLHLAQDRASLVGALLVNVKFDDDDLIELIENTGREHHQVIASREDLSANIWIALARAAPVAPPFDHQSSLALWSDDLGITQTQTHRSSEAPAREALKNEAQRHEIKAASQGQKSATITALHPERPPSPASDASKATAAVDTPTSIRILRTDKDLIADRTISIEPSQTNRAAAPLTEAERAQNTPPQAETQKSEPQTSEAKQPETQQPETQPSRAQPTDPSSAQEDLALTQKGAQDPGPGGWSWISDRDGFITSISPRGLQLHGAEFSAIGTSMLDLLGLNTKLGHPVARAFQRRSAIHDAPIFLPDLEEKNQHWTLEATPYFSSSGGIFEGYEGILTPVIMATEPDHFFMSDEDATALFLDDMDSRPAANLRIMPATFTDQATVFQPSGTVTTATPQEGSDKAQPVSALKVTRQTLEDIAADLSNSVEDETDTSTDRADQNGPDVTDLSQNGDKFAHAATAAVQEVLAEALAPLSRSFEAKKAASSGAEEQKIDPTAPSAGTLLSPEASDHIKATFDMLEAALAGINSACKTAGDPHIRLQSEIAAACVRSLKDQLK